MKLPEKILKHFRDRNSNKCWCWKGAKTTAGYGQIKLGRTVQYIHRISYMFFKGEIPKNLVIDHLCRHRSCFNPTHLELVTLGENSMRGEGICVRNKNKTHCINGHEFSIDNIYKCRNGRVCKKCTKERMMKSYYLKKNL